MSEIKAPKKLIEVALPLDDINVAASQEKTVRHGHPSSIHLWWSRKPLSAARAVLFSQLVNDPGYERNLGRGINKEKAQLERERLFELIRELIKPENSTNEHLLSLARKEIQKSWEETCELNKNHPEASELFNPDNMPGFHDPFAGGGTIPLEAQRLGLTSYGSDLNPVSVLLNKAMIELPPKFSGRPAIGPIQKTEKQMKLHSDWSGAKGLAEDVMRYGTWVRDEAVKQLGELYPSVTITKSLIAERPDLKPYAEQTLTVIAWIWAKTVKSPNPAFSNVEVPLVNSFWLSSKKGKEAWVEPVISPDGSSYKFVVRTSGTPTIEATVNRNGGVCLLSDAPIDFKYIRSEGKEGRIGAKLMGIVAEGKRGRVYLPPDDYMESVAKNVPPQTVSESKLPDKALGFRVQEYGLLKWQQLFSNRQLTALTKISDIIQTAHDKVKGDALASVWKNDEAGATAYADAISIYLAFALDKMADLGNTLVRWEPVAQCPRQLFGRQAIPMSWGFAEANPLSTSSGSWEVFVEGISKALKKVFETTPPWFKGYAVQADAATQNISQGKCVSTDPPYYDNIGYADLSDFFYLWLRRTLKPIIPDLFNTLAVPKAEELVAEPFRHGNKETAETFFLNGMTLAMQRLSAQTHPAFPVTIYYAFKQSETKDLGTASTGWETFLEAVLTANFVISGTWPFNTENTSRMRGQNSNALASSIVLVCRRRDSNADSCSRRDFIRELRDALPEALEAMIGGKEGSSPIAPVDLAQAAIGPGMAVFSKFTSVVEADGSKMSVHSALTLINKELDDYFGGQSFDEDTNFCISWFDENGWRVGVFGQADVLAKAKGTSVDGVKEAGVIESGSGSVRLLKYSEYPPNWTPENDNRTPVWEALHQLIRAIQTGGESTAGALLARMPERAESIRQLAYRLYTLCERKGWAEDARPYNELITAWHEVEKASHEVGHINTQIEMNL